MKATTVKLEGKLLARLAATKPEELSLTAYVKRILQRGLERQMLQKAGVEYAAWLRERPEAYGDEEEWAEAPLARPPKTKRKKT